MKKYISPDMTTYTVAVENLLLVNSIPVTPGTGGEGGGVEGGDSFAPSHTGFGPKMWGCSDDDDKKYFNY